MSDTGPNRYAGRVRRFFAAWRHLEETLLAMDHGPYDHLMDRLHALETRVAELEVQSTKNKTS